MNNRSLKLVIVGVGGQGILTVSEILGIAAISEGMSAIMSEVHGMAQRGGVVTTEMKIGDFSSPLIGRGDADVILGFEPVETYRMLGRSSRDTNIVTNVEPIVPPLVTLGMGKYPSVDELLANMKHAGLSVTTVKAQELAMRAGSPRVGNIVMLGALASIIGFILKKDSIEAAICHKLSKSKASSKMTDINLRAFELGFKVTGDEGRM